MFDDVMRFILHVINSAFICRSSLILLCAILGISLRGADAKPRFSISVSNLGAASGAAEADAIAAVMSGSGWCSVTAAPQTPRWNKRPESVSAKEWISLVLTRFGAQAHAFVFIFDGPNGTPHLLAHVPFSTSVLPGGAKKWITPLSQISEAIHVGYARPPRVEQSTLVNFKLSEWPGLAEKEPAGVATPVASISIREALPPLEAMLCAALCENGFTPTWEPAALSLRLEFRPEFKTASMRFTRQNGNASTVRKKEAIPEDFYYGYLTRSLFSLQSDVGIADFSLPAGGRFRLIAATPDRIYGVGDNGLLALDPRNGKRLWPTTLTDSADSYAAESAPANGLKIFRYSRGIAAINLANGEQKSISNESPGTSWAFSVREDNTAVVTRGTLISAHRNGAELSRRVESSDISAGPIIVGSQFFVGNDNGDLICSNVDNCAEKWRKNFGGELRGGMAESDQAVFVFNIADDALLAVSTQDGTLIWKQVIGDVLLKTPTKLGTQLLVAGKNNRILLLNAADGKIMADVQWPTWLIDVQAVAVNGKSNVVCTDIGGMLSILDTTNFKTVREVKLPARPSGEVVYAPQFPPLWGSAVGRDELDLMIEDADVKPKPTILVTDVEGFLYIIPIK